MQIKFGKEITATIPLDGSIPIATAKGVTVQLDTIVPIPNGIRFENTQLKLQLDVTDTITLATPIACVQAYAPDALATIQQVFVQNCTI